MRVEIRPWKKADAKGLALIANNPNIHFGLREGFPFPYRKKDADDWIMMNKDKQPIEHFAIFAERDLAGGIGYLPKDNVYRKNAEIGYRLGEAFWGKGIATQAVGLIVDYIFAHLDIERIYADVFSSNPASMRVLEKNNFHLEAVHRKSVIKNNQILDEHVWVKFRDRC